MAPKRLALAVVLLLSVAAPASAQISGNAAHGATIAQSICAACHAVTRDGRRSPNPMAPTFFSVATTLGMTDRALRVWLQTSHPTMPNYVLNRDDTDDIVAYILSLKER